MKKLKFLGIALLMLVLLVGCSTEAPGSSKEKENDDDNAKGSEEQSDFKIGVSISTLNNPYFVNLRDAIVEAADKEGVKVEVADAQNDTSKQLSDVEDMIQSGIDLLLINAADSEAVVTAIEAANKENIPVITLDRKAEGGDVLAHIASDNVAGGKLGAEYIIEQLGEGKKVVELQGILGVDSTTGRGSGFNEGAEGKLEVVAQNTANYDRGEGLSVMEDILQSIGEIDAVFAHNDEMALGALEAIKSSGRDILVVGFDGTDDAVASIEAGEMAASVAQQPDEIGRIGVETALKVLKGEEVEKEIPVDLKMITK